MDRLYGYDVSQLLWKKVGRGLSAGRVQSVAVRLIVQRERERMAFVASTYWDLIGSFAKKEGQQFEATLMSLDGRRVRIGFHPSMVPFSEGVVDGASLPSYFSRNANRLWYRVV